MARQRIDRDRVPRMTYPTLSLTVFKPQYDWLESESKRRNVSKSVVIREILAVAMATPQQPVAQP